MKRSSLWAVTGIVTVTAALQIVCLILVHGVSLWGEALCFIAPLFAGVRVAYRVGYDVRAAEQTPVDRRTPSPDH